MRVKPMAYLFSDLLLFVIVLFLNINSCIGGTASDLKRVDRREFVSNQEFILGHFDDGTLRVTVTKYGAPHHMNTVDCRFYLVSAFGRRSFVDEENCGNGFCDTNLVQVDDFCCNGRKQVMIATHVNNSVGKVFDFDGQTVSTIYDTAQYENEDFESRTYLSCRHLIDGQAVIQEAFHLVDERLLTAHERATGFNYVKSGNCIMRVIRWQNGKWTPVRSPSVNQYDNLSPIFTGED